MAFNKSFKKLSAPQADLSLRIFDLVIGRVFKKAYLNFAKKGKENMEKVFLSDDDKEKEKFIKKNIPNFKKLLEEESKKIEEEIKVEISSAK